MTTLVRALGFTGVGAIGLAALGFASPAHAATVAGCGDVPVGATLTNTSGVCELDFATAGDFSWTMPSGITSLYAVLVGGGGGAYSNGGSTGYAGGGGEVKYIDLGAAAGTAAVTVGAGGSSAFVAPSGNGQDTVVELMLAAVASGGNSSGAFSSNFCSPEGTSAVLVGPGNGAGGAAVNAEGEDCGISYGPSVNPSTDVDSDTVAALTIFSSLDTDFGAGGIVVIAPDTLSGASDLIGTGNGASVLVASDLASVTAADSTGGSGRVIFRYTTETSAEAADDVAALATTGTDVLAPVALLSVLGAVGVAFLALARRRRVATSAAKR